VGRRVQKAIYTYSGGWPTYPDQVQRFVYDGWNVVMVLDGNNVTQRKYAWGLDLSGSIHGAGGIGGLLACEEPLAPGGPKRYWYFYDANGNVGQLVKTIKDGQGNVTGVESTLAAHYEYDPYGNVIASSGKYADGNPIRFSTKWYDAETDMYYFGYRYYLSRLGRWGSEDPREESGGLNLYGFVGNGPTNRTDILGLFITHYDDCNLVQSAAILRSHNSVWKVLPPRKDESGRLTTAQVITTWVIPNNRPNDLRRQTLHGHYRVKLLVVLDQMIAKINSGVGVECECECDEGVIAYVRTPFGTPVGDIHFCPPFFARTANGQAETFMHELSHLAADTDDLAWGWLPSSPAEAPDDAYYVDDLANETVQSLEQRSVWVLIW